MSVSNELSRLAAGGTGSWLLLTSAAILAGLVLHFGQIAAAGPAADFAIDTPERLGQVLFHDVNLSRNRTQACATCHAPEHGFADPRQTSPVGNAVSLGDDGRSLGDRNTPSASYAALTPPFKKNSKGRWAGGQFHDGRAATLEEQAGGPPLNPIEMGMPDKASVVRRLKENAAYVTAFEAIYGRGVLERADDGYAAMTKAIAAFERTSTFAPFDSKYDRYVRGEEKLSEQEELGRVLFFSSQFTNCSQCHKLREIGGAADETFSNYEFHNIGTPPNRAVRAVNGTKPGHVDHGLTDGKIVSGKELGGRFKTPSLRNVAVTGPYMHNGVFKELRTVILFYNKYVAKSPRRQINPETGKAFDSPEVAENLSLKELKSAPALDDKRIDALVAFLKTLTDKRYEHLLAR
jgi:cytochrome c peroxidase